ncbi:TnsA endonuclease N-terminal domain-containing protein [Chromobacterium violaceum]|uniref:TnsA endonuclease N-terminal domain-containing protein n=1 Tax=Chromobacterium violaceum TaxID=536 RepID=UPI001950FEC6|nr:TnsA endonuclease N-terminal domain-containing protein [Chromobacterium violaceum]QRO33317.1 TnsA endonuclease N-terminal domain-containing protein [Chromobacterium violaceum]QRQ16879.1 TnsA endonuclease N-terminal domain-containing protein [Chromobacterium violaceum]
MPVRKIPKNYRNVTGIAAHRKANGPAMFESTLERDFITLLEFDPGVETFEVQPLTLEWTDTDGKIRRYTPDVLATFKRPHGQHSKVLYEVKYRDELRKCWQDLRPKLRAAVHYARAEGWRFKIVTEVEIRSQYLDNAKFLLPFVRQGPAEEAHMDLLDEQLSRLHQATPAKLLAAVFQDEWNQARLLPSLWYLVGTGQIGTDLSKKLTMTSPIWSLHK